MGGLLAQFLAAVVFINAPNSPGIYIPLGVLALVMGIVEGALSILRAWCPYVRDFYDGIEVVFDGNE
jgi:hypothetical protein